jgi:hypothetical protein
MADDVQVTFSASIEKLLKGIEEGTGRGQRAWTVYAAVTGGSE